MTDRRAFLKGLLGAAAFPGLACGREAPPPYDPGDFPRPPRSRVALLRAEGYGEGLAGRVREGLRLLELPVRGRRVVLKPNFVEYDPEGVINTHPLLVGAAADAFLRLDAAEVVVAEGPGHRRDNEAVVTASGLEAVLRERRVRYVDLNWDATRPVHLRSRFTALGRLHLPRTVLEADLLVSMPKMKTHHWAGVTLSMKNLFGIVPGAIYGWPKNPLHWAGIDASILDLNAALEVPRFAIVDGIVGMEGDGPLLGEARASGLLAMGEDYVAVDASCARAMGLRPDRVPHLAAAGRFLGHLDAARIEQRGERLDAPERPFRVLPHFEGLRA